eukprot:s2908_g3.t1
MWEVAKTQSTMVLQGIFAGRPSGIGVENVRWLEGSQQLSGGMLPHPWNLEAAPISSSLAGFEDSSTHPRGVRASMMLRWLIAAALAVAVASTCVKDAMLTQDPMLPAPAIYVQSWTACQKKCQEGPLCHSFSFKEDSIPVGACWLFPATAQLKEVADVKAHSGPKACEAAVVTEQPAAVLPASGAAASDGKAGLRGYGIPAAAAHSYGVANAGHDVPGAVFKSGEGGKTLVATPSNSSATNLAIAGGVGAAVVAAGAFFMLPGKKKKTKRGLKREEEDQVEVPTVASTAPLVEPPQLVYPGTSQAIPGASVASMAYAPQMLQPLPMAMAQSYAGLPQGGEYMMYEPVTAMQQQYVYDQGQMMAYQPVQAQ